MNSASDARSLSPIIVSSSFRKPSPLLSTAESFLRDFFATRDLAGPDGRPLYRYRIGDAEFDELERILSSELKETDFYHRAIGPKAAMAFCLWASDWWRRNYESGAWKWQPLVEALGHPEFAPGEYRYGELQGLVTRGLRAWHRTLHRAGYNRNYLGTLVCEGGLPLQLILREETHLRHYLEDVLDEFQLFGAAGVPPRDLAERVRNRLPRAWRRNVVYELCGELIQEICRLQGELGDTDTPVLDLDRLRPGWRDELPVRVTDQVARELLNGLLVGAMEGARRARVNVRWNVDLVPIGDVDWGLRGSFELPKKIREEAMHRLFPRWPHGNAPQRFTLGTRTAGGSFRALAVAIKRSTVDGGSAYRLDHFSAAQEPHTVAVATARKLVARITGSGDYPTDLFRGAPGLADLPWVFVPDDDESGIRSSCRFAGQGSVRSQQAWCLVAVNRNVSVECLGGEAKHLGVVRDDSARAVYRVSGRVRFFAADGTQTTVETEADSDSSSIEYYLVGAEKSFDNGTTVCFLGAPHLHALRDGVPVERVSEDYLQWKPDTPDGVWIPYSVSAVDSGAVRGRGRLRYMQGDEIYHSVLTAILPIGADITIHPSSDPRLGEIRFTGLGDVVAAVPNATGLDVQHRKMPDGYRLVLSAIGEVPREVTVVLDWNGRGRMSVTLPFPARRAAFLDPSGCPLPENARLAEGSIAGVHAEVIVPDPTRYHIQGTFVDGHGSSPRQPTNTFVRDVPEVVHGHHLLDLAQLDHEIAERLELSDRPGAAVRLEIVEADSAQPFQAASVSVRRFDLEFEPVGEEPTAVRLDVRSLEQMSATDLRQLKVEILALLEPDEEPIRLGRGYQNEWSIPVDLLERGPYLVLGRQGARQRARPMPWYAGDPAAALNTDSAESTSVAQAYAQIAKTGSWSSDAPFEPVLQEMASDPGHEDWDLVFAYLRQESLPVMTFPLLRALVRNPVACVMAAADASESNFELLWERMELFPFAWWQIPVAGWQEAYESYADHWQEQFEQVGDSDQAWDILARQTDASINDVKTRLPGLYAAFDFLSDRVACRPISDQASKIVTPERLRDLYDRFAEHRQACPAFSMPLQAVPDLPGMRSEVQRTVAAHGWCKPLFRNEETDALEKKRTALADSPALTAALVLAGITTSEELARAIRQVRTDHRSWFDEALRLAQLFCFGRKQRDGIQRHLNCRP